MPMPRSRMSTDCDHSTPSSRSRTGAATSAGTATRLPIADVAQLATERKIGAGR